MNRPKEFKKELIELLKKYDAHNWQLVTSIPNFRYPFFNRQMVFCKVVNEFSRTAKLCKTANSALVNIFYR